MRLSTIIYGVVFSLLASQAGWAQEPFQPGEKIVYSIKKFLVRAGEATLVFEGPAVLDGRPVLHISFTSTSLNFLDQEDIYCDPQTYLPVLVKRNLNIWGNKETIVEAYDAQAGKVVITKTSGGQTTQTVIEKKDRLENIYCFLYRYRRQGTFQPGESIPLNLPTATVMLKVVRKDKIQAGGQVHEAYYLESDSGEYRLWFGPGPQRIPLRIDGAIGLGSAALVMTEYQP